MEKVRIGILGCGNIAPAYLKNLTGPLASAFEVAACADVVPEAVSARAKEFGIPKAYTPEELMADDAIELVVNLTPAPIHLKTSLQILKAGKHLFSEKPLALSREDGRKILDTAKKNGLQVGGAADTFLSAGQQVSRKLLESGKIGDPIAANVVVSIPMFSQERYHKVFRGALLDLGPYYLTALHCLFGSAQSVAALAPLRFASRTDDKSGKAFEIDQPSTTAGAIAYASGPLATVVASQDVHGYYPRIELLGTKGKMTLPDANMHSGTIVVEARDLPGGREEIETGASDGFAGKGRGLGVAEMAAALRSGRPPRANGELMYHILDTMLAFYDSASSGKAVAIESQAPKPEPFGPEALAKLSQENA